MNSSDGEIPPIKARPVSVLAIIVTPYLIGLAALWLWLR